MMSVIGPVQSCYREVAFMHRSLSVRPSVPYMPLTNKNLAIAKQIARHLSHNKLRVYRPKYYTVTLKSR